MSRFLLSASNHPSLAFGKTGSNAGFSFIELIITVAIMGILATVALPMIEVSVQQTKEQELRAALRYIREGIDAYKQAVKDERIEIVEGESGYPRTLESLVDGVPDAEDPQKVKRLYFLRRIPPDPMYEGAAVAPALTWGRRSYASPPQPPQAGVDVYDVYSLSTRKGLNGIPYNEW